MSAKLKKNKLELNLKNTVLFIGIAISLLFFTTCDAFNPGLGPAVDINAPRIGITSHVNGAYISQTVTLAGYVEDDTTIRSIDITGSGIDITAEYSKGDWSALIDTIGLNLSDGEHELTISATDSAGKITQVKIFLIVDNGPPTILVSTPRDYTVREFNKTFVIKGEATDTTRVDQVRVSLYDSTDTAIFVDQVATGTNSWYYSFDSSLYPIGDYHFNVEAEDKSGNINSYFYHFDDLLSITNDPANTPNIEDIHAADNEGQPIAPGILSASLDSIRLTTGGPLNMDVHIDQDSDEPQFTFISPFWSVVPGDNILANPQRLSGFVEDDDAVDASTLEIAIWDFTEDPAVDAPSVLPWTAFVPVGNQWTYNMALTDGEYWVRLRAEDIYSKPGISLAGSFKVSSFAPVVSVYSPPQGTYVGPTSLVTVQVLVSGLGAGDVRVVDLNDDGNTTTDDYIVMTPASPPGGEYNYETVLDASTDFTVVPGAQTFKIQAGTATNYGTATLQYTGDTEIPTVTVVVPPAGEQVNGTFDIRGTSSDNNLVDSVYLWIEEDAFPSLPADPTTWLSPTNADVYNWTRSSYDTTLLNDGAHTIHIAAFDKAGNLSDPYSQAFTVSQVSDRPVITLSNLVEGTGSTNGLGPDSTIIGYIEDDDNVDVASIEIRIDIYGDGFYPGVDLSLPTDGDTGDLNESEDWIQVSNIPSSNTRVANWSHSLINLPEGYHEIQIRVFDTKDASGQSDYSEITNPNYAETLVTGILVDAGPPDLTITAPSNNSIFSSTFDIFGTATDPNGISDVNISIPDSSNDTWPFSLIVDAFDEWRYTFDVDVNGSDDGEYSYQVQALDSSGSKSTLDRQFVVDATKPDAVINTPAANEITNGSVEFSGTASDNYSLDKVYYNIQPKSEPVDPVFPDNYVGTAPDISGLLAGRYSWNDTFDTTAVGDDEYVLRIKTEDKAGNIGDAVSVDFFVDQSSDRPTINISYIDKNESDGANNVLLGATSLNGTVEDDDAINPGAFATPSIELNIDNAGWEEVTNHPAITRSQFVTWQHDISLLSEGLHHVKIRARDELSSDGTVYISGYNWAIEDLAGDPDGIPFILNFGPPNIIVNNPLPFSYHNSSVTIDGTSTDANNVKTIEISFDGGAWYLVEDNGGVPTSPLPWSYLYTVNSDGTDDGTVSYRVRATDSFNSADIQEGQFTVDATKPTISINQPTTGSTVNGSLNITGTATDAGLDKVYYIILVDGVSPPAFPDAAYTEFTGNYSWNDVIDTKNDLPGDDDYTLHLVATDNAGNVAGIGTAPEFDTYTVDFTVDQTTDRPNISYSSITEAGTFVENLLPGSKQITGTIIDDDSVAAATVEYQLYDEFGVLLTAITPDWTPVGGQPPTNSTLATWSHTFGAGVTDGKYQIKLRAADIFDNGAFAAGEFGWAESPLVKMAVDTANPETTVTSPASNGGYINQDFTIAGVATDAGGIKKVEIEFDSNSVITTDTPIPDIVPYNTSESWTSAVFDIDEATNTNDGILYYTITVTDAYDKIKTLDRYINVDTRLPVINALNLVNNDQTGGGAVNGSALIQGSPIDYETLVSGIYLRIEPTATNPLTLIPGALPAVAGGDPSADWILLGSTTNLNYRFDTSDYTEGTPYTAYLLIKDQAGNLTEVGDYTLEFTPIQGGNTPSVSLNTTDGSILRNSNSITGTITDDDGVDVSTIEISLDGGATWITAADPDLTTSASDSTSVTFSYALSSVAERVGAYTVQVAADDIGEDFADDTQDIAPSSATSASISVFVDDTDPAAVITLIDNGKISSPTIQGLYINDQFVLTGTASDGVQVQEVRAKLTGEAFTDVAVSTSDGYANWTWTRTGLSIGSDTTVLNLEVEDVHGRVTTYSYTLLVDETLPGVSYITATGTYHGTFDIRGTSSDNVQISGVFIAEGTSPPTPPDAGNPAADSDYTSLASPYSWTHSIDTLDTLAAAYHPFDTDLTYYVSVVAVDGAGNLSAKQDLIFVINQGSDRPNLSFTNVDPLLAADANLLESNAKVLGSVDDDDGLASIEIATSADGFASYSPVTTDGTTPLAVSGLNLNWQSYVAGLGEGVHTVRFRVRDTQYATTSSTFNETISADIPITIDTGAPTVNIVNFNIDDPYSAGTTDKAAAAGILINNTFIVSGTAVDGNSVSSVRISTDGSFYEDVDDFTSPDWTHLVPIIRDGSGTQDGTLTVYITATDQFAKSTTITLPVTIDTLEPEITPTQPAGIDLADPPNVNGPVTLRGSITEVSTISSFSAIGGDADDVVLPNIGTNLNWVLDVDSDLYANSTYSTETDPGVSDIWRFPVDISALDAADNRSTATYKIDIDPNSDKPFLYLTAPADASSVAGAFIVQGTVTDDDDIQKVTIQVDIDNDGLYTSGYDLDGIGGIGNSDFENEWIPVDVPVTNGSWNILMNQSNEFKKDNIIAAGFAGADGNIGLKVIPYDVDNSRSGAPNLAGDPIEISIYVDSTLPIIEGQGQAVPSPADGSIVKGISTIQARFKDDSPLINSRMMVSYDGGQSFATIESRGGTVTPRTYTAGDDY